MTESMIRLSGVTKRFGQKTVLDAVDFEVRKGTVTGLLGRNGAGKTTLLKCSLGLQSVQEGTAMILGELASSLSAKAKANLGYVPQEVSLYSWMKVRQIIAYTRSFYPRWNDDLVDRLISEWQLDSEQRVGTLSTGQTQTLAILLAMGHEPDLLVLDEPVASLDPAARRKFLRALLDVAVSGERTILFSTHITSDIERVADQVAVLKDGKNIYDNELGALKESVRRLRVVVPSGVPDELRHVPGLLRYESNGTNAVFSVQQFNIDLPEQLRQRWKADVSVEDLNLEEIFLELHHE